jgi:acyl-CoA thioester hydrolase
MGDEHPAPLELEPLWRGAVQRWQCDENDHLNVRFHFAIAAEALEFLCRARFDRVAPRVRRQHARFVAEARVATPLLARGGVVAASDSTVTVYVEIVGALGGEDARVHSTFTCELAATPGELGLRPASLPGEAALPAHGARRGLPEPIAADALPVLARAEALDMVEIGRGVLPRDAGPEDFVGRISDGILRLIAHVHGEASVSDRQAGRVGGAVVEYELVFPRPAPAGTAFVARSGIAALEGRVQHFSHWLFDAGSGEMLCGSNAIAVALDLETRRAAEFTAAQRATIEARCLPELLL